MRILVTGANGFLGRHVVLKLLSSKKKEDVIRVFVREGSNLDGLNSLPVEIARGSLNAKQDIVLALHGIDTVIHLAAMKSGNFLGMFYGTVVSTENLLNCLENSSVTKFILISSFSVYGVANLRTGSLFDESSALEHDLNKRDAYTLCKFYQEKVCRDYAKEFSFNLVVIRPATIYGENNLLFPRVGFAVPGIPFFFSVLTRGKLPITYVDNCAEAIARACFNQEVCNQTFNIIDDDLPTRGTYLEKYQQIFGKMKNIIFVPYFLLFLFARIIEFMNRITKGNIPVFLSRYDAAIQYKFVRYSNSSAKTGLNWMPKISLMQGLIRSHDYCKKNNLLNK